VVPVGVLPRVLFVLIQFSGDMEHGMRSRIYLGQGPRRKVGCLRGILQGCCPQIYKWYSGPRES
jgi:hypothetical protein